MNADERSRTGTRTALLATLLLASTMSVMPMASAWEDGGYSSDPDNPDYGTHDWIAEAALDLLGHDASWLAGTYRSEYLLGTEAPDNPVYIGDNENHHVYYASDGQVEDDIAAVMAAQMHDLAASDIMAGRYADAAYHIGAMSHYISDLGVFGHTMGYFTDWGDETHHSDYEDAVGSMTYVLDPPTGVDPGTVDPYDTAMDLARKITFGSGTIKPNVWMDDNYDWNDQAFLDSAIASVYASVVAVASAIDHLLAEVPQGTIPEFGAFGLMTVTVGLLATVAALARTREGRLQR